jgi:hypothetical protein
MAPIESVTSASSAQFTPVSKSETSTSSDMGNQTGANLGGAPQYLSPVTQVDPMTGVAVTQIRDRQTGDPVVQYPSQRVVEEYARHSGTEKQVVETAQATVVQAQAVAAVAQAQASTVAAAQQSATSSNKKDA